MGAARDLNKRAKEHPKPGPLPEPRDGELISDKFQRAHYLEFMLRWGGLWLIAMTFFFIKLCWTLLRDMTKHEWVAVVIICGLCAFFVVYLWRLSMAARRWVRIVSQMDLQDADRRTLAERTAELDERERSLTEREEAVTKAESTEHAARVSKAAATRKANAEKRAQQAAELAEIARELEDDDDAAGGS